MATNETSSSEKLASLNLSLGEKDYTRFEKARMIGSRALQISQGAEPKVKLTKADYERIKYNPVEIAKMEFEKGVIPLSVKRNIPLSEGADNPGKNKEDA
ncbi:MAG: DNA-directed RNA polymerase subunit K [Candidatus Woesearchaeota archaeon]